MAITALLLLAAAQSSQATLPHDRQVAALELLVESAETKREWNDYDRQLAGSFAKQAGAAWRDCLDQTEGRLLHSREAVETVATAVLGACLREQRLYERALASSLRGVAEPSVRTAQAGKVIATLRADRREQVISKLVEERLSAPKAK